MARVFSEALPSRNCLIRWMSAAARPSAQYAKANIRANSIHPGVIETPMTAPNLLADEQARQITISRHPIGRLGQSEDVTYGALFLASDESSFMTGSELVIDGGLTAQ